jgi:hypothetical protein
MRPTVLSACPRDLLHACAACRSATCGTNRESCARKAERACILRHRMRTADKVAGSPALPRATPSSQSIPDESPAERVHPLSLPNKRTSARCTRSARGCGASYDDARCPGSTRRAAIPCALREKAPPLSARRGRSAEACDCKAQMPKQRPHALGGDGLDAQQSPRSLIDQTPLSLLPTHIAPGRKCRCRALSPVVRAARAAASRSEA